MVSTMLPSALTAGVPCDTLVSTSRLNTTRTQPGCAEAVVYRTGADHAVSDPSTEKARAWTKAAGPSPVNDTLCVVVGVALLARKPNAGVGPHATSELPARLVLHDSEKPSEVIASCCTPLVRLMVVEGTRSPDPRGSIWYPPTGGLPVSYCEQMPIRSTSPPGTGSPTSGCPVHRYTGALWPMLLKVLVPPVNVPPPANWQPLIRTSIPSTSSPRSSGVSSWGVGCGLPEPIT